jgi:enoyl-CoA hydratase/carnithine racemase
VRVSEFREIRYAVTDNVATVSLDRPARLNAWTGRMAAEYRWALYHADADENVGAIVVTGAGDAFCVGTDQETLSETGAAGGSDERMRIDLPPYPQDVPPSMRHNHTYPLGLRKVVIAAINGSCAGAGFVLACFADLRIAAQDVEITPSFAGLGLPAEYGIAWMLPRIVGWQNAFEILLTSAVMTGREAVEVGFARRAWERGGFQERVHEFARDVAQHASPSAIAVIKRQLHVDAHADLDTAYRNAVAEMNRMVGQDDFERGLAAMRAGRRPRYLPRDPDVR